MASVVAVSSAQMPDGAFLNQPAGSTSQLTDQVRNDPQVAARFVKHYRMSREEVIRYFSTLRLEKLREDTAVTVYGAQPDGTIRRRTTRLPKGTLVWIEPDGTLALRKQCGNPLSTGPRIAAQNPKAKIAAMKTPSSILKELAAPEAPVAMPAAQSLEPIFTVLESNVLTEAMPPAPPAIEPLQGVVGSSGGGFAWPLLGLPFLFTGGGGGGGTPPGVPEPATVIAILVGCAPLARAAMKRKGR